MSNTVFAIDYDAYRFRLDRKALTVTLAGWAEGMPVGWIELEERSGGARTRHDFADCRLVSLSEKMGAQGKRILFGLDAPGGVPIDLYFTCGPKEVQLVVEASRDSRSHRIVRVGVLPGLLAAGEALALGAGLGGAVRSDAALAIAHDSPYARWDGVQFLWEGDPERRRLDLRLIPLPGGDPLAVARACREWAIREGFHLPLRKKARQSPALAAFLESDARPEDDAAVALARAAAGENRWDDAEARWSAEVWDELLPAGGFPFHAALWRDAVVAFAADFPTALLNLTRMVGASDDQHAVLAALHRRSVGGFLTGWDEASGVVRAEFSHGVRLVLDTGGTGVEDAALHLPPGGFWVAHTGFAAHDALRVGDVLYPARGLRWQEFGGS